MLEASLQKYGDTVDVVTLKELDDLDGSDDYGSIFLAERDGSDITQDETEFMKYLDKHGLKGKYVKCVYMGDVLTEIERAMAHRTRH